MVVFVVVEVSVAAVGVSGWSEGRWAWRAETTVPSVRVTVDDPGTCAPIKEKTDGDGIDSGDVRGESNAGRSTRTGWTPVVSRGRDLEEVTEEDVIGTHATRSVMAGDGATGLGGGMGKTGK